MKTLSDIYRLNNCDKGNQKQIVYDNGSVAVGHNYGDFYEPIFEHYVGNNPKILELGVWRGASMLAHNEYFKGNCELWGVDVDNDIEFDVDNYPNMHYIVGNSEHNSILKQLALNKYDIIIDDASHIPFNQTFNLCHYSKMLNIGGVYILEDLHCSLWNDFMKEPDGSQTKFEDSPLYFLISRKKTKYMPHEDYSWLISNIKTIDLRVNNNWNSITSIITFK